MLCTATAFSAFIIMWAFLQRAADGFGFAYVINVNGLWLIFGVPTDNYSFRNLFLPLLIAKFASCFPSFMTGLVVFQFPDSKQKLIAAVTTVMLILGAFCLAWMANVVSQPTNQTLPSPYWSLLFLHYFLGAVIVDVYLLTSVDASGQES